MANHYVVLNSIYLYEGVAYQSPAQFRAIVPSFY